MDDKSLRKKIFIELVIKIGLVCLLVIVARGLNLIRQSSLETQDIVLDQIELLKK